MVAPLAHNLLDLLLFAKVLLAHEIDLQSRFLGQLFGVCFDRVG